MDIDSLKDALGDEAHAKLSQYIADLVGQRDAARAESISGRKALKEKLSQLESAQSTLMEKLGVSSLEDIDALPDAKGAAEAAAQYEARLKRMERQLAEAAAARDEVSTKYRESLKRSAIADAMGGHDFLARDLVETYVGQRLTWEGDDLLFRADDGRLVPLADGVAGLAKSRPELLKPQGAGGAGVRQANAGSGTPTTISRAEFEALPPARRVELAKAGVSLS